MMFLMIILLCLSNAFSDEGISRTIKVLNHFNSNSTIASQNTCSANSLGLSSDQALLNKCAIDICGSPKKVPSPFLLDSNFDQYVKKGSMRGFDEIEPQLLELIKGHNKENSLFIHALKDRLKDKEVLEQDFSQWRDEDYEEYASNYLMQFIEFEIDMSKPIEERLTFTQYAPENFPSRYINAINDYASKIINTSTENFYFGIQQDIYTISEAKNLLRKQALSYIEKLQTTFKNQPNSLKNKLSEFSNLNSMIYDHRLANIEDIQSLAYSLNGFETNLTPEKESKFNFCTSLLCKSIIEEKVKKINTKMLINELEEKNTKNTTKEKLAFCKSEYAMKVLENSQNKKFLEKLPMVKSMFMEKVFKNYSKESKDTFKNYLDKDILLSTDFQFETLTEYTERVQGQYKSLKNKKTINFKEMSNLELAKKLSSYKNQFDEISAMKNFSACNSSLSYVDLDTFVPREESGENKDKVLISPFSCTHHVQGANIVSHELAHALSSAFLKKSLSPDSYQTFLKIRKCADNLHSKNKGAFEAFLSPHPGDNFRTEEDTADLISFIANSDDKTLSLCSLLEPTSDGNFFKNPKLVNEFEDDPHSAALLRVLQEAIHKDIKIPTTCKSLIDQNKNKFRFTRCF